MQNCIQNVFRGLSASITNKVQFIHTSAPIALWKTDRGGPRKWESYNKTIFPPQQPEEAPRPAYVCHMRTNIRYSMHKMWYVACLVRGMSVEEAIKQLSFVLKKGALSVREVIQEAQQLAVEKHNVEFKSNLWVAESFVTKGKIFKGVRRHARARVGHVEYAHCHYYVRLEEGEPPEHYYHVPKTPQEQLDNWLVNMRKRKVVSSL